MKPILTALVASLCLPLPALAQSDAAKETAKPTHLTLMLDWFVNPDHGPIIIAQQKGYFADEGLDVDVVAPADPSDPPKMVAAGRADIGISYEPQLHLQVAEGMPLVRVGTLIATPLNCLLTLADSPIKSAADLKGKRIGFSVAGVEEALVSAMLKPAGLTLDDVDMVNVNWSLSPAVMSGQVDAVIGAYRNFELNQMQIEGVPGKCIYPEENGVPSYDELIYIANPKTMNREALRRFLHATERGAQYIVNHPEESWKIFSGTSAELNDELNHKAWEDTIPRFSQSPAALDAGRYAHFEQFLHDAGLIDKVLPVSDLAVDLGAQTGDDSGK